MRAPMFQVSFGILSVILGRLQCFIHNLCLVMWGTEGKVLWHVAATIGSPLVWHPHKQHSSHPREITGYGLAVIYFPPPSWKEFRYRVEGNVNRLEGTQSEFTGGHQTNLPPVTLYAGLFFCTHTMLFVHSVLHAIMYPMSKWKMSTANWEKWNLFWVGCHNAMKTAFTQWYFSLVFRPLREP